MSKLDRLREELSAHSPIVRNAAAIELMDSSLVEAVPVLIEAIERPENRNARGTLIYALSAFDCSIRFCQLFRWAAEGGYEATGVAISIIREQDLQPLRAELVVCEDILSDLRSRMGNIETSELVCELEGLIHGTARQFSFQRTPAGAAEFSFLGAK